MQQSHHMHRINADEQLVTDLYVDGRAFSLGRKRRIERED